MPDLLLELFSEEIPARMQAQASADLQKLVTNALVERGLPYEGAAAFATPRRLALHIAGLPARQPDTREEKKGPRVGAPDAAVQGFLKSAGLASLDQAKIEKDPKGKGEFYLAVIEKAGRETPAVLAEILPAIIRTFPWPKSMRWGAGSARADTLRWVRPLHTILCTFGLETEEPDIVAFEVDGIASGNTTRGHRFMAPDEISVRRFDDYVPALEKAKVVLDPARRRDIILHDARDLAHAQGLELVEDDALLHEVAGLVEWPVVLLGSFDKSFLDIPAEVIRATIRANQKCFVLRGPSPHSNGEKVAEGRMRGGESQADSAQPITPALSPQAGRGSGLANRFLLVANIEASDGGAAIVAGNERVIRARLSDALHFWKTDQAPLPDFADKGTMLDQRMAKLRALNIVFHEKLGTQGERVERIKALAKEIAPLVGADPALAERAAELCKADLMTEVVGEFPEVQGLMGARYAALQGEHADVCAAIEEHYKPQGPGDQTPKNPVSIAVALADKLDTLVGFWAIDEKPTGSKDPYALRRAALGVIRIVLENGLRVELRSLIELTYQVAVNHIFARPGLVADRFVVFRMPTFLSGPKIANYNQFGSFQGDVYDFSDLEKISKETSSDWIYEKIVWHVIWREFVADLLAFFHDRLKVYLRDSGARHDLIDAVLSMGASPSPRARGEGGPGLPGSDEGQHAASIVGAAPHPGPLPASGERGQTATNDDLLDITRRVEALGTFLETDDGKNLLAGYKRANNIVSAEAKKDKAGAAAFDDAYAGASTAPDAERALASAVANASAQAAQAIAKEDFAAAMQALSQLRAPGDTFFGDVTVNDPDPATRLNRLRLLNALRRAVNTVADFSKISG